MFFIGVFYVAAFIYVMLCSGLITVFLQILLKLVYPVKDIVD